MENKLGKNFKKYDGVIVRRSSIGDDVLMGDNVFVTDSNIGNHCSLERRSMVFNSSMNDYSYLGYNTVMKYTEMGKFCSVSWNVSIGGLNHPYKRLTTHPFPFRTKYGISEKDFMGYDDAIEEPLKLGNDVWIAANACITRGISIADGAVIGAGAVVTKDIGAYEIWAGVPAKKIGQRFNDEIIQELEELKWWEYPEDVLASNLSFFDKDLTMEMLKELKDRLSII